MADEQRVADEQAWESMSPEERDSYVDHVESQASRGLRKKVALGPAEWLERKRAAEAGPSPWEQHKAMRTIERAGRSRTWKRPG